MTSQRANPRLAAIVIVVILWNQAALAYKVAIIGGGISGTFAAKYLSELDVNHRSTAASSSSERDCLLDEIVVYDTSPPPTSGFPHGNSTKPQSSSEPGPQNYQGSRVSSITLQDGSVVELGASIIYEGNQLVVEMMKGNGDPAARLKRGRPNGIGKDDDNMEGKSTKTGKNAPSGFGIYHGEQQWLLNTASLFSNYPSFLQHTLKRLYLLWRYNLDMLRLHRAVKQALRSFDMIYLLLNDTQHDVSYFDSPADIWESMGLKKSCEHFVSRLFGWSWAVS